MAEKKTDTILVAAGRGERAGFSTGPKQYRTLGNKAVIRLTLERFLRHPRVDRVVIVIHPDDHNLLASAIQGISLDRVIVTEGGKDRQESALRGLETLVASPPDYVLIHDGVRPFCNDDLIDRVIEGLSPESGVLAAIPISDTIKRAGNDGYVIDNVARENLHAAQTPQGFPFEAILQAHRAAQTSRSGPFTDDAAIASWAGLPVQLVNGNAGNIKITWPEDFSMAERMIAPFSFPDVRTGNGYDTHTFAKGDYVILCGVKIPHDRMLSGHSDADVGLHALTDALLATIGEGDIGTHFPPSDPKWKGADSRQFIVHAVNLVRSAGGRIANVDVTIIAEAPKIGPHRTAMTKALTEMLSITEDRVSIKATTNERMGFVGRQEGIAAIATASVIFPGEVPA